MATPLCAGGTRVLPEGTELRGVVRQVRKVGLGIVHETAGLNLEFTRFTHEIQSDVDLDRDKVVHDLVFTGCVDSVEYMQRPEGVRETGEDYRKGVITDARVAVVTLNGCTQPPEDFGTEEPLPKPAKVVQLIRRVTLTARNHFVRDNLVYRTADAIRLSYLALRKLDRQLKQEGHARQLEAAVHGAPSKSQ